MVGLIKHNSTSSHKIKLQGQCKYNTIKSSYPSCPIINKLQNKLNEIKGQHVIKRHEGNADTEI